MKIYNSVQQQQRYSQSTLPIYLCIWRKAIFLLVGQNKEMTGFRLNNASGNVWRPGYHRIPWKGIVTHQHHGRPFCLHLGQRLSTSRTQTFEINGLPDGPAKTGRQTFLMDTSFLCIFTSVVYNLKYCKYFIVWN